MTRSGAMVGTQPTVSGDSGWVNSQGFFRAPPDAATLQIHLTMNTQGTLRHDGIVLCEVLDGEWVRVHTADVPEWCRKLPQGAPATDGWSGWWPDPLAPGSNTVLTPGQTRPLWFTIHAPKQAEPGLYRAEITLSQNTREIYRIL
ncbi:MAG TPA: hypothetical protein P5186_02385 [Candidatus Paceibacterota bacterium]|nr:hypothetical protein [Verrucomicrobiota bacterium]HRY46870.1 hypothetical protein [Candidatus Paceibacterota bacterium]HSA02127.1 hypothetical protein [Candidatus Paceibacterota bacterium]